MTLALNQISDQVTAMGRQMADERNDTEKKQRALKAILETVSNDPDMLREKIARAEAVLESVRFSWVGAAPAGEALAEHHPPPEPPEQITVIASDGSQIHPDRHSIALYYLVNIGAIIYRHGSGLRPETLTDGRLYYGDEVLDEQGFIVPGSVVNVQRDLGELQMLVDLVQQQQPATEPLVTLIDGQFTLRTIDLPGSEQEAYRSRYLQALDDLRRLGAIPAAYIDRPRSSFVIALLHLAGMTPENISEETLRLNPYARLSDAVLFEDLPPGHRSALFNQRAKANIDYADRGHQVHFFYLNTGSNDKVHLARVEIPEWVAKDRTRLNALHAALLKQCRMTQAYPYALARAHELAIVNGSERQALETMLSVQLRKQGLDPSPSPKQQNKNVLAP